MTLGDERTVEATYIRAIHQGIVMAVLRIAKMGNRQLQKAAQVADRPARDPPARRRQQETWRISARAPRGPQVS